MIRNLKSSSRGFSLIELMIAVGFVGIIALTLANVLGFVAKTGFKSREQTIAANLSQRFFTRLNNLPYSYVFDMDSSSASYGLTGTYGNVTTQVTPYPYLAILNDFTTLMKSHKFDRFTLDIRFMVRDLGDLDSDGQTTDLRYYLDSNADGIDQYDIALRYFDQNGDGDFRDTYSSPEVTEDPHTRLKEATFKLYKAGNLIYQDVQLISWEKFTGSEGKAAGATLTLVISTPSENSTVYAIASGTHSKSFNFAIAATYPESVYVFRSDTGSPLHIMGETTPGATFSWKLGTSTGATLDTCTADVLGVFDCTVTNIARALQEGSNTVWGQAYKTAYYSPWTPTTFIRDVSTPIVRGQEPTGTVHNLQPTVRAILEDVPHTAGRDVSGINSSVIRLFRSTTPINYTYSSATGYVTWVDSTTNLPPVLSSGTYTIVVEGGDNAMYKNRSTWTFTIDISTGDTDHSAPSVDNKYPVGGNAATNPPAISVDIKDQQTGIDLNSVALYLDGAVIVSSATGNLSTSASPLSNHDGFNITFTPDSALSAGWHTLRIVGNHWATDPANKITQDETWMFFH